MKSKFSLRYLKSFLTNLRLYGISQAIRLGFTQALRITAESKMMRSVTSPSISDLLSFSSLVSIDPTSAVSKVTPNVDESLLREWSKKYVAAIAKQSNSDNPGSMYPSNWTVDQESAVFLYLLVRLQQPSLVVETGVADGRSSTAILLALEENDYGRLVSIDVRQRVGSLIPENIKGRWDFRLLPKGKSQREEFAALVDSLEPIDIFLHDSDHSYDWQKFEFDNVLPCLAPHGLVLSDDADASFAFVEFCQKYSFHSS
jgi:predicted O-methyltransferase YrrM